MRIRRRQFIALTGAAAVSGALPSFAQEADRVRTIGFLMGLANDTEARARTEIFEQALEKQGWIPGENIRVEYRFAAGDAGQMRLLAKELVQSRPDLIVGHSTPVVTEIVTATRSIPIVFVVVADPVGSGFAASIPRPGGNATGFTSLATSIAGKLLTILKQITPDLTRVALMYNPDSVVPRTGFDLYRSPFEAAAYSFSLEAVAAQVRSPGEIERHMTKLAHDPNVGLIIMPDNFLTVHRHLIVSHAARLRIPTVYPYRYFVEAGGLMSYGVDVKDLFRRSAEYVSRILRGEKPADLPIQAPTKFELVINMKAAKALGLTVPRILLATTSAVIE